MTDAVVVTRHSALVVKTVVPTLVANSANSALLPGASDSALVIGPDRGPLVLKMGIQGPQGPIGLSGAAVDVTVTPIGNITADDVQEALEEIANPPASEDLGPFTFNLFNAGSETWRAVSVGTYPDEIFLGAEMSFTLAAIGLLPQIDVVGIVSFVNSSPRIVINAPVIDHGYSGTTAIWHRAYLLHLETEEASQAKATAAEVAAETYGDSTFDLLGAADAVRRDLNEAGRLNNVDIWSRFGDGSSRLRLKDDGLWAEAHNPLGLETFFAMWGTLGELASSDSLSVVTRGHADKAFGPNSEPFSLVQSATNPARWTQDSGFFQGVALALTYRIRSALFPNGPLGARDWRLILQYIADDDQLYFYDPIGLSWGLAYVDAPVVLGSQRDGELSPDVTFTLTRAGSVWTIRSEAEGIPWADDVVISDMKDDANPYYDIHGPNSEGDGTFQFFDLQRKTTNSFDSANTQFDNAGTGLSSTNVQDALAELDTNDTGGGAFDPLSLMDVVWVDSADIIDFDILVSSRLLAGWSDRVARMDPFKSSTNYSTFVTDDTPSHHPGVSFAAANETMTTPAFDSALTGTFTIVVVAQYTSGNVMIGSSDVGAADGGVIQVAAGNYKFYNGTALDSGIASDANYHVFVGIRNAGADEFWIDGVQAVTGDSGSSTVPRMTLAAYAPSGSASSVCHIAAAGMASTAVLGADLTALNAYLTGRFL